MSHFTIKLICFPISFKPFTSAQNFNDRKKFESGTFWLRFLESKPYTATEKFNAQEKTQPGCFWLRFSENDGKFIQKDSLEKFTALFTQLASQLNLFVACNPYGVVNTDGKSPGTYYIFDENSAQSTKISNLEHLDDTNVLELVEALLPHCSNAECKSLCQECISILESTPSVSPPPADTATESEPNALIPPTTAPIVDARFLVFIMGLISGLAAIFFATPQNSLNANNNSNKPDAEEGSIIRNCTIS